MVVPLMLCMWNKHGFQKMRTFLNAGNPKVISSFFFLSLCLLGPFIVCLSGHVITDSKEKLFISAYNNAWYSASPREKSSLVILLCQASKIKRLNYKNLLDFNMERYSVVVQGTYSYITLLQGADL
nr:uncharacterized protein LOC106682571 isoform X1 [Halyomorpha halys]